MSNLQQCRVERVERDFTVLSNRIVRDKNISLKAKGLFLVVMSLNESNWDFSINGLTKIVKEGKNAIYGIIDELKEHGYCHYEQRRDENGKMLDAEYTFFEEPRYVSENNPLPNYRDADNRDTENRTQLNTENNQRPKKEESITDVMPKKFDFRSSVIGLGVPPNIVDDWLKVRKTKRASNTETAFNLMEKEVAKACELYPMATPEILVKIAVERNWMGVRCDFYRNVNFSDYIDEQPKEAARQLPLFDEKWQ